MKRLVLTMMTARILAGLGSATVQAQETEIHERKVNQQKRIANGVKSGELTPKETAKLENKQANLNKQISTDRKANGGNLTNNQKKQINARQNKLSQKISNQKHDAPGK